MTTDEMVALLFEKATGPAATIDPASLRAAGPIKVTPYPDGQTFATPSGKLEFYSSQLEAQGLPPLPDWLPDADDRVGEDPTRAPHWPLQLLTAPGYLQSHTAFSGNRTLRKRAGAPMCVLHPDDAAARGLRDGDAVDLVNDRGSIGFALKVSDETLPGTVFVPGQRPTADAQRGTVNVLCDDRYSDLGDGATYQSTRLDVRRAPVGVDGSTT
jgi:anaerobic selenocysteine-containing dehydrogenase